jgi:hypothetical protein
VVHLSWIKSVFDASNIPIFVMDEQMSVLEGSVNAIPRRVMVRQEDYAQAMKVLGDAQSEFDG